jgi:nucleotide-binding universal stress UspA family protein
MIREIFVPLLRRESDDWALDAALALATTHEAHISALVTIENPLPMVSEFGYVHIDVSQRQLDEARASATEVANRARTRLSRQKVGSEVRLTDVMLLWSEETAALQARHCDISVLGAGDDGNGSPRFVLTFKSLLLNSGRPVLVIPKGANLPSPARRVVLAWKPTREAARAIHDALPLLAHASEIDVLMVDPQVIEGSHGPEPGADIARHLARHGLKVNVVALPREGYGAGANLLRHVQAVDADLLVMGGYGHARWREAILGGTTRTVLAGAKKPVLFSH